VKIVGFSKTRRGFGGGCPEETSGALGLVSQRVSSAVSHSSTEARGVASFARLSATTPVSAAARPHAWGAGNRSRQSTPRSIATMRARPLLCISALSGPLLSVTRQKNSSIVTIQTTSKTEMGNGGTLWARSESATARASRPARCAGVPSLRVLSIHPQTAPAPAESVQPIKLTLTSTKASTAGGGKVAAVSIKEVTCRFGLQLTTVASAAQRCTFWSTALSWKKYSVARCSRLKTFITRTAFVMITARRISNSGLRISLPASALTNRSTVRPAPARTNARFTLA